MGRPALLMAFLPALFEIAAFVLFAPLVLEISRIEAAVMGSVLMIAVGLLLRRGVALHNQPGVEAYKKNMFALLGKP